jgi:hypothetical protein
LSLIYHFIVTRVCIIISAVGRGVEEWAAH